MTIVLDGDASGLVRNNVRARSKRIVHVATSSRSGYAKIDVTKPKWINLACLAGCLVFWGEIINLVLK